LLKHKNNREKEKERRNKIANVDKINNIIRYDNAQRTLKTDR